VAVARTPHIVLKLYHNTGRNSVGPCKKFWTTRTFRERRVGAAEAEHLVVTRPADVLANVSPSSPPTPEAIVVFFKGDLW
jgi:hypothetical protein